MKTTTKWKPWKPATVDYFLGAGPHAATAAEIRKLADGNAVWFLRRPDATRLLASILGSTPEKLGLVPFEIQSRDDDYSWRTHATSRTLEAAEDLAWSLLTRHGGDWRVLHGSRVIGRGFGYRPGEPRFSHDRTATWAREQKERK